MNSIGTVSGDALDSSPLGEIVLSPVVVALTALAPRNPAPTCADCRRWLRGTRTGFATSEKWDPAAADGHGFCRGPLRQVTAADFGCLAFEPMADPSDQEIAVIHQAEPWQVWEMAPCPACRAVGSADDAACDNCVGTGQVRRYGDGYLADERTRAHPHETELRKERDRQGLADLMRAELAALDAPPEAAVPARVEGFCDRGQVRQLK